jgi:general stress protein 26
MATTPTNEIDARFSDPGVSAQSWDDTRKILETAEVFWITTVRADGRPHVTPLVAVWFGDSLYFCTGAAEQKGVNLATNSHVILSTGCNRWDEGVDVVVEGDAVRVTDDGLLRRLAEAWTTKWDGRWKFRAEHGAFQHDDGGEALVFAVAPRTVLAFAKGAFAQTRHRF